MARKTETLGELYFEAQGQKFPLVPYDQWKQSDVKLVCAVTEMGWRAWQKAARDGFANASVLQGFFAVAVQRKFGMDADSIVELVDGLPLTDGIKLVVPEADKTSPPGGAAETAASETQ